MIDQQVRQVDEKRQVGVLASAPLRV